MVQVFTERCLRTDCTLNHANATGLVLIKSKGKSAVLKLLPCYRILKFWGKNIASFVPSTDILKCRQTPWTCEKKSVGFRLKACNMIMINTVTGLF